MDNDQLSRLKAKKMLLLKRLAYDRLQISILEEQCEDTTNELKEIEELLNDQ